MTCLITNIGNRNITFDGVTYKDEGSSPTFLNWTRNLLENYENSKEGLDINIINPLVNGDEPKPDKIILLFSDQSSFDTRTNQDTKYEAEIIKKLLVDKYGYDEPQVELVHTNCKVTDNGHLMQEYRSFLLQVKKQNFDRIIICDAGGTAQQKMGLKIMAEFILPSEKYIVKYVEKNSIVSDVSVDEYRSVINLEQAIQLLSHGHFDAAADLCGYTLDAKKNSNFKERVFKSALFWFNGNRAQAKHILNPIAKHIKAPLIRNLIDEGNYSTNDDLIALFDRGYDDLIDLYYKCIFYISIKRYSEGILAFAIFYERFLDLVINVYRDQYLIGKRFSESDEQKATLKALIELWYPTLTEHKASCTSISSQVLFGKIVNNQSIVKICKLLSPHIDHTDDVIAEQRINSIRNKIAHEGLYLNESKYNMEYSFVQTLIENIGLELRLTKSNQFKELTELIESNLRS